MALVHQWLFDEGSGTQYLDNIGTDHFTADTGKTLRWATGTIRSKDNVVFAPLDYWGFAEGLKRSGNTAVGSFTTQYPNGSISLMFRELSTRTGAFFRLEFGTALRTANDGIDSDTVGAELLAEADYKKGTWHHLVLIDDNATNTHVYLNKVFIRTVPARLDIDNGPMWLFNFSTGSNAGGLEMKDLRIYDNQLNQTEIDAIYDVYGDLPTSEYSLWSPGDDFGGSWGYFSNLVAPTESYMEIENNTTKLLFDGNTCRGGRSLIIPKLNEFWGHYKLFIPSNFQGNHDLGVGWNIFIVSKDYINVDDGVTDDILVEVRGVHSLPSQQVDTQRTEYTESGSTTNVPMSRIFEITKDVWHTAEIHCVNSTGVIQFWLDGELLNDISGVAFGDSFRSLLCGLHMGVHPENTGNYFYIKDMFVGESRFVSGGVSIEEKINLSLGLGL